MLFSYIALSEEVTLESKQTLNSPVVFELGKPEFRGLCWYVKFLGESFSQILGYYPPPEDGTHQI